MTSPFNLIDEPWVPCALKHGQIAELGLAEVLRRAPEIVSIAEASPLRTICLYRLLLALTHRVIDGPKDDDAWDAAARRGRLPDQQIDAYLSTWRHRFNLFDEERPFMQVRGLPEAFEPDSVAVLVEQRGPWGGGRSLFEHRAGGEGTLSPGEAARGLLMLHAFSAGGLVKKPGEPASASAGPLRPAIQVLIQGRDLFETLMLNLLIYAPKNNKPIACQKSPHEDCPSWEQDPMPRRLDADKEVAYAPRGWLDLLTWQSRRLELRRDASNRVTGIVRAVGRGLELGENGLDPFTLRRADEKRGIVGVGLNPERALWRDIQALVETTHAEKALRRPLNVLEASSTLSSKADYGLPLRTLALFGLAGDQAKTEMVRAEVFPIPRVALTSPVEGELIRNAMEDARAVEAALRAAARTLARFVLRSKGEADPKDIAALTKSIAIERRFWPDLRPHFDRLVLHVEEGQAALRVYHVALARLAHSALSDAEQAMGPDARHCAAGARARDTLLFELADLKLLKNEDPTRETPNPEKENHEQPQT
jgi:CRISPR system Cascade subunit CasA